MLAHLVRPKRAYDEFIWVVERVSVVVVGRLPLYVGGRVGEFDALAVAGPEGRVADVGVAGPAAVLILFAFGVTSTSSSSDSSMLTGDLEAFAEEASDFTTFPLAPAAFLLA